jgi:hypothetical protein
MSFRGFHAGRRPQHPVNQRPLLTRETENSEGENAGCGRNPDGCARTPESPFPNLRMTPTLAKTQSRCEKEVFALESESRKNARKPLTRGYKLLT